MDSFVREVHEAVLNASNDRVQDKLVVTFESNHDAVRGALNVQRRYGFDRGPADTCQQVAVDYAYLRPRDWIERRMLAAETVKDIVERIERESQGWQVRRFRNGTSWRP